MTMLNHSAGRFVRWISNNCRAYDHRLRTPWRFFLLGTAFLCVLAGCGGSGGTSDGSASPGSVPGSTASAGSWQGRYVGTVMIGDVTYFGDALLTVDGAIRLYIGGPYPDSDAIQMTVPGSSAQLVGTLAPQQNQAAGAARIFGQACTSSAPSRFCRENGSATISIALGSDHNIQGDIDVTTSDRIESWVLQLYYWDNYFTQPAIQATLVGHYQEQLAEFARGGDTIVSIDAKGVLFFQSPHSGCTGNGQLRPHLDGAVNVYDVTLVIESCTAPYDYLNTTFEGLASTSPGSYWDYDVFLRMWLSQRNPTAAGSAPQPGLTLAGWPQ
jgi:hypothetical protein